MTLFENHYQSYNYKIPSSTTGGTLSSSMNSSEASSTFASIDGSKSSEPCGKSADKKKILANKVTNSKKKKKKEQKKSYQLEILDLLQSPSVLLQVPQQDPSPPHRLGPQASPSLPLLKKKEEEKQKQEANHNMEKIP
ncbi:hypothetical protein PS029_20780 [Yersinia pestis]|nr:hypothetical protein [Yersinia pestis]